MTDHSENKPRIEKWYFKMHWFIFGVLLVGPFALPMVWFNPHYTKTKKIIITIIVIVISYFLAIATMKSVQSISEYYAFIADQMAL